MVLQFLISVLPQIIKPKTGNTTIFVTAITKTLLVYNNSYIHLSANQKKLTYITASESGSHQI